MRDSKVFIKKFDYMPNKKKSNSIRIYSWNVNGIRAIMKKGFMDWFLSASPDILCLQETKALREQVEKDKNAHVLLELEDYESFWFSAEKKGYSGVSTFSKHKPVSFSGGFAKDDKKNNFNNEGRVIVSEYEDFFLWNVYFPNGGRGPERVKYKLEFYEHCLKIWEKQRKQKKLIICGDFNTAHKEIDLARPKENQKTSGFLPEERAFLNKIFSMGYVDIFRQFNEKPGQYTYWDQITRARDRNVGWRIDFFAVTEETVPGITDAFILPDVMGSDHCPLGIEFTKN